MQPLFIEVHFKPLAKPAGLRANNPVDRGIVVLRPTKNAFPDILLVDLFGPPIQAEVANVGKQTRETLALREGGRQDDAIHQRTTRVACGRT